jgi:hypothetical protein
VSQHYSDPSRADDPNALPDVEVFYVTAAECIEFGSGAGWYYWFCFPGCLPDSDPIGPYESEAGAVAAAQEDSQ